MTPECVKVQKSSWLKHIGKKKSRETDLSSTSFPKPNQAECLKELGLLILTL